MYYLLQVVIREFEEFQSSSLLQRAVQAANFIVLKEQTLQAMQITKFRWQMSQFVVYRIEHLQVMTGGR